MTTSGLDGTSLPFPLKAELPIIHERTLEEFFSFRECPLIARLARSAHAEITSGWGGNVYCRNCLNFGTLNGAMRFASYLGVEICGVQVNMIDNFILDGGM